MARHATEAEHPGDGAPMVGKRIRYSSACGVWCLPSCYGGSSMSLATGSETCEEFFYTQIFYMVWSDASLWNGVQL